jgi:hypothetical protein
MLGANVVHMSLLAEYLAMRIGAPLGVYRQFTNNMHAYLGVFSREKLAVVAAECAEILDGEPLPPPGPALELGFDHDLPRFMTWARGHVAESFGALEQPAFETEFMKGVAAPVFLTWQRRKKKLPMSALLERAGQIAAPDWRRGCVEWLQRRQR